MTNAQLETEFRSDCAMGLSEAEARRRLRHGKNNIWEIKTASPAKYIASSMLDFAAVLLLLTAVAAAFFQRGSEAAVLFVLLALCRTAGAVIYIVSQRIFEKNASAALPRAKVVRGGTVREIPADCIVAGDVIVLDAGDTVPCDIRLTAADGVSVFEGNVTDRDGIVNKDFAPVFSGKNTDIPISLRKNMLYASSTVVSGFSIGIAVSTGKSTLIAAREGSISIPGGENVPLAEKLSEWSRICSLSLVVGAFIITALGVTVGGQGLFDMLLPSVASAAACLGEFVGAVGVLAFAWSLRPKKQEKDIFKNVSAALDAACTDVLMLRSCEVFKSRKITLHSYYKNSELRLMGTKGAVAPPELLSLACYCTGTSPSGSVAKGSFGKSVRQSSVLAYDVVRDLWNENCKGQEYSRYTVAEHITAGEEGSDGFDSTLLCRGDKFYFAMSGRAEGVIARCSEQRGDNGKKPFGIEEKKVALSYAQALKKRGVTVCAVATRESPYNSLRRVGVLQSNLCFEGFVGVSDRAQERVPNEIRRFRDDGGRVVVFSDITVAEDDEDKLFLQSEGIFSVGDTYISLPDSEKTNSISPEAGTLTMVRTGSGVAGIRERLRYMNMMSEQGLKVAYMGYGVEDMWCMQKAPVSYALPSPQGAFPPQVLRTAADAVCDTSTGGFDSAFKLMKRCRGAVYNIGNVLKYLLFSHSARFILMLICAVASLPAVGASELVLWGLAVDFAVSAAISTAPSHKELLPHDKCALSEQGKEVLYPALLGVLCAAAACASPFFGRALLNAAGIEYALSEAQTVLCMYVSCIVAMPFAGAEITSRYGLFSSRSRYGKLFVLPFVTALSTAVLTLTSPISNTAFPGFIMCAFMLIPTALVIGVMSAIRAAENKKK